MDTRTTQHDVYSGMHKRDYYKVLGVERTSTVREIKKAYHKLAMVCHPDKNQGNCASEMQFKEISEAYQILSCDSQRERYDVFGHADRFSEGSGFETVEDIFSQFNDAMNGVFGFNAQDDVGDEPCQGSDIRHELSVSFEESVHGAQKTIQVRRDQWCDPCGGDGAAPDGESRECTTCHGTGEVKHKQAFMSITSSCSTCQGLGHVVTRACQNCHGRGRRSQLQKIKINIPAGVAEGMKLKVRNEGELGELGAPRGDLFVIVHPEPSTIFERDGLDLLFIAKLSWVQAAMGCTLTIPGLDGSHTIEVLPGTQSNAEYNIPRGGIRHPTKHDRKGELQVQLDLQTPSALTDEQRQLLEQLSESMGLGHCADLAPSDS